MFILLLGFPPFNGKTPEDIMESVKVGQYPKNSLNSLSPEAADLIKQMLTFDRDERPSAKKCLEHDWIRLKAPNEKLEGENGHKVLRHLKSFTASKKLEEATLSYIINFLIDKEEMAELKSIFIKLDTNNDGCLTKDEIIIGYSTVFGIGAVAQVDRIFENVDKDNSGTISYDGCKLKRIHSGCDQQEKSDYYKETRKSVQNV